VKKQLKGEQSETGAHKSGYPNKSDKQSIKAEKLIWNYESIVTKRFIFGHSMGLIL
jgi:hypothetical protein